MKKVLLLFCVIFLSISYQTYSQTCPGDIVIIEDENLTVWKVESNGSQLFSLAGFVGTINIGDSTYFTDDIGLGDTGLILMAHDIAGTLLWHRQLEANGFFTTNPALAADGVHVYISATASANDDAEHQLKVEQFQALDGTPGWSNVYTAGNLGNSPIPFGAQTNPYGAVIDASSRLIITGTFTDDIDLGGVTLSAGSGISETFVMALDTSDGTDLWATQSTGSNGRGRAWTIATTPTNEVVIAGRYTGSISFGGTPFTAGDLTTASPYVAKLDPADGSEIWLRAFEGQTSGSFNNIYDVSFDPVGNVYYAGSFLDAIDVLGNTVNSASLGEGGVDALIGALDSDGNYLWANQLGGSGTSDEFATTIVYSTSADALYVGAQLVTDSLYYQNLYQAYPSLAGHYIYGIAPIDGSIDINLGNNISAEFNFGYSALYDDSSDTYFSASLISNTGTNVLAAQWIPNRPKAIATINTETGVLDPSERLTAFDPGGGNYTFQWFRDGLLLTDSINNNITVDSNGQYSVEVTSQGGCTVSSEQISLLDGSTLESDSLALVDLYFSTNGDNWVDNGNWLLGDVTTWAGVVVNGGRVTELDLQENNLEGTIPNSFTQLSELVDVKFGVNSLNGTLPDNIGNLSNLVGFEIFGNQMSGPIPSSIGNLTNLVRLYATDNSFSGPLPSEIGNLTALEGLAFNNNQITGPFPTTIENLTSAFYFEFINNPINDVIPAEIGNMPSLQYIQLENAQIIGSIPVELGNLSELIVLNIGNNQLTGAIPTEVGNLSNLQVLIFFNNALNTTVPVELGSLTSLTTLNLESCQLQGTFPDAIWQISSLQDLSLSGNNELNVTLPGNLASLLQFINIRLDNTLPLGGDFPEAFYSLDNLVGLSLGNKQYTGTLDSRVGGWTQLDNLYLWNNELEGDFPAEIIAASNLRALSITGNQFTSFPDLSSLSNLTDELSINFNQLDFDAIIPNLGIQEFTFSPQNRREDQYLEVPEGGSRDLENTYTASGNVYQWVRNQQDSISTSLDLSITNAQLSDLGGYFAWVTNSAVPDLTLRTPFYNLAFEGDPRSFTVDNSNGSIADFKSFYAAFYGTNEGDTLYVTGSDVPYDIGGLRMERQRIIFGPGYFLSDNSETQANDATARVTGINLVEGSDGTRIYGIDFDFIRLNNVSSASDDVLNDIVFQNNRIRDLGITDDVDNVTIAENFIDIFTFASTTLLGTSRDYTNVLLRNNIIDTVTTSIARTDAARNNMTNVVFERNTINVFTDSIGDASLTSNIVNDYQATSNSVTNNQTFAAANFTNNSGNLNIDNDFEPTDASFDAGAFSGNEPYKLSGINLIPHIFSLEDIGRIRLDLEAKNEADANIVALNYLLGENGNIVSSGDVRRLVPGNPVQVLFRPKLGQITPGADVKLQIWAEDENGLRSVPTSLDFVAETTTATGQILTSTGSPVTNGEVLLFEINQEETAFDTLSTSLDNQGNFTFSNIVVGDYLALGNPDPIEFPNQIPTYYTQTELWQEADTLLIETSNPLFEITLIEEPREEVAIGRVAGFLDEELKEEGEGGRIEVRGRVRRAGVSMRRGRSTGRTEEDEFDLIAYLLTDDNGEFFFENLPPGNYKINFQYPGFPMDTLSDVDILIEESRNNDYNLEALVDEGQISVTILTTTGLFEELIRSINVYPNPASEFIKIDFYEEVELNGSLEIELISILGESVLKKEYNPEKLNFSKNLEIPISTYKSGSYILKIQQNSTVIGTIRLIIR